MWETGHPVRYLCEGSGLDIASRSLVLEHVMVASGKAGARCVAIAFARTEEERGGCTNDLTDALGLRFVEPSADEVTAICCGVGAGGSAGNGRWGGGRVFEVEKRRGERVNRVSNASSSSFYNVYMVEAVRVYGRAKIESASGMGSPRGTCEGGFECIAEFPGRANGMGVKVERKTMKAVVGGEFGIGVPWL